MAKFGEMNALAAGSGYQALVCIFLLGGNDGHNTVIPITTAQQNYSLYQQDRGGLGDPAGLAAADRERQPTPTACTPAWSRFRASTTRARPPCWPTSACWCSRSPARVYLTNNSALVPSRCSRTPIRAASGRPPFPPALGSYRLGRPHHGPAADRRIQARSSRRSRRPTAASLFCTGVADVSGHGPPPPAWLDAGTGMATLEDFSGRAAPACSNC